MPIYEYRCPRCGQIQEAIRCIADRYDAPLCFEHPKAAVEMQFVVSPVRGIVVDPAVPRRTDRNS